MARPTTKKPRRYDAEDTRRRILAAAEAEFAAYGFDGARVDRIARAARANKAMIYQYFTNKESLYRTVFMTNYGRLAEQEELLALTEEDLPRLTRRILEAYFDFHERNPDFWRFLAWENLTATTRIEAETLHAASGAVIAHLESLYLLGQERNRFHPDVSFSVYIFTLMAVSFFHHSNMATLRGTLWCERDDSEARAELIAQLETLVESGIALPADT